MELFAQIVGYVAMATVFCSFQVKNPKGTIIVMGIATGLFSLHMGLLGAVVGCVLNGLNVFRSIAVVLVDTKTRWGKLLMHGSSWLYAIAPFIFSLFPSLNIGMPDYVLGVVMMLNTYSFWTRHEHFIRVAQVAVVSPGWIWYNAMNGSMPGIITECMNIVSIAIYYLRSFWKKLKKSKV